MSKLFFSGIDNTRNLLTNAQVVNNIDAYWGTSEEITFPIHQKMLEKIKESSNLETKLVCLEVHNIESKNSVVAYWKPFNNDTIELNPTLRYYILSNDLFLTLIANESFPVVVARIYQTSNVPTEYGVFCHKASLDYKTDGTGSDPTTSNSSGTHL